jgi:hypothetical protein
MISHIVSAIKEELQKRENKELITDIINPFIMDIKYSYYFIIFLQFITIMSIFYILITIRNGE